MKALTRTRIIAALLIGVVAVALAQDRSDGYEVLSLHDTDALFLGMHFTLCKGKTALCPYECGGSGTVASFQVLHYNDYQRTSEWADEMADTVQFMLDATDGSTDFCPDAKVVAQDLAADTRVHLVWRQLYPSFTSVDAKVPCRQVLLLELSNPH